MGNLEDTWARIIALFISTRYQYLKTGIAVIQYINKICVRPAILEVFHLKIISGNTIYTKRHAKEIKQTSNEIIGKYFFIII